MCCNVARPRARCLLGALGLALLLGLAGVPRLDAGEDAKLRQEHAKLARKALKDLLSIWKACQGKKVDGFAMGLARQVVHFEEDHAEARARLGQTKNAAGEWAEESAHKLGFDEDLDAVAALSKKRESLLKLTVTALGGLLDRAGSDADAEQRSYLLDDLAALAPNDPRVASGWNETRVGTRWVSVDAWRSDRSWDAWTHALPGIAKANKGGGASPPPELLTDLPGIVWTATWKTADIPVWTTGHPDEARYVSEVLATGTALMRHVLAEEAPTPKGLGVVVLAQKAERARFVAGLKMTESDRQRLTQEGAYALPGTEVLVTARSQGFKVRTDSALRMLYTRHFRQLYGLGRHSIWAEQAFSITLTHATHGTRLTVMGGRPPSDMSELEGRLEHDLFQEQAPWMAPARDLANQDLLPTALDLAPQRRSDIYVLELLSCCAHGAFLLRAHPDKAPKLFRALGEGKSVTEALELVFQMTPEAFHQRLVRFLNDSSADAGEKTFARRIVGTPPR